MRTVATSTPTLEFTLNGKTVLADIRRVAVQVDNPSALQAAAIVPEPVLMIGDRLKMNEYNNVDQQRYITSKHQALLRPTP